MLRVPSLMHFFINLFICLFSHISDFDYSIDYHPYSNNNCQEKEIPSTFYDGKYRLLEEDPSVDFYKYSWANAHERAVKEKNAFASSYGYTDPFEDFAEVYAIYIMQGDTAREWRNSNAVFANKYQFVNNIYNGKTFPSTQIYYTRPYDVTMMAVSYDDLLR